MVKLSITAPSHPSTDIKVLFVHLKRVGLCGYQVGLLFLGDSWTRLSREDRLTLKSGGSESMRILTTCCVFNPSALIKNKIEKNSQQSQLSYKEKSQKR